MARLASAAKGGFYETPPTEAELICKRLRVQDDTKLLNILDTCCGKGDVLQQFKKHFQNSGVEKVNACGNEMEKGRFEEAQTKLDQTVSGGYESLRTSPTFSFLWGNPPYEDGGIERMEVTFLRLHTLKNERQMLQKNAVVALCIPQHVLADVAPIVASRLDDVSVYRFTDDHYDTFKQVVLFGYFREPKKKQKKEVRGWLKEVASKGPQALPTLAEEDGVSYDLLASEEEVSYFRGYALDPSELLKDLQGSSVFEEVEEKWMPSSLRKKATLKKPILPLKTAHVATAIAAGAIDGHLGEFVIEAYTKSVTTKEEIRNEEGMLTHEEFTTKPVSITRVFHPLHGIIDLQ